MLQPTAGRREDLVSMASILNSQAALALMRSLPFTFRYPRGLTVYPPASPHGVFVSGG
jgi:hypothetical protein